MISNIFIRNLKQTGIRTGAGCRIRASELQEFLANMTHCASRNVIGAVLVCPLVLLQ